MNRKVAEMCRGPVRTVWNRMELRAQSICFHPVTYSTYRLRYRGSLNFSPIQQHNELQGQVQRTPVERVICTSVYYLGEYLTERHEIDYSDYPHLIPRFVLDDAICAEITSVRTLAHLPTASVRRLFKVLKQFGWIQTL